MPHRTLIGVFSVTALLAFAPCVAQATSPPSVAGTWLHAQGSPSTNQITGDCDEEGATTLYDSWKGTITAGPYAPGTYSATATVSLSATDEPNPTYGPTGRFGLPGHAIPEMRSHVVITSGTTTIDVVQTRDLTRPEAQGVCSAVVNFTDPNGLYWFDLSHREFFAFSLWTATITTPNGRFEESGKGWISSISSTGHYDYTLPDGTHTSSGAGSIGNSINLYAGTGPAPLGPQRISLTPADATGAVGTTHDVTANVTDAAGGPVPASVVLFSVTGVDTSTGRCTTDSTGSCSYSYTGPDLPGADAIRACADANTNGISDSGEPCSTATQAWLLPSATAGQATGGGHIANTSNTDQIAFGFNVRSDTTSLKGEGTLVDPSTATKIKLTDVTSLTRTGEQVTVFGHADVNGIATTYRLDVVDMAEPGARSDTFRLRTAGGYLAGGTLTRGNIQVHRE